MVNACCRENDWSIERHITGFAIPAVLLVIIGAIAVQALRGELIARRYVVTPTILGYGAIIAGVGSYFFYLNEQRDQLRECPALFLGMAALITPLIIVGGVCVSGHLSLIQTAKAICIIAGIALTPLILGLLATRVAERYN